MKRLGLLLWILAGCSATAELVDFEPAELEQLEFFRQSPLPPPDSTNWVSGDPKAAALGQFLFFDPRLSGSGEFSCASCHDPDLGFADGLPLSDTFAGVLVVP